MGVDSLSGPSHSKFNAFFKGIYGFWRCGWCANLISTSLRWSLIGGIANGCFVCVARGPARREPRRAALPAQDAVHAHPEVFLFEGGSVWSIGPTPCLSLKPPIVQTSFGFPSRACLDV